MITIRTVTMIIPLQALVCCLSNPIGDGRTNCSSAARTDLLRRRTHGRHGSPDSDETAPRPTTPVQESDLALWRAKALERMPYFAPILFSLRVLDAPALGTSRWTPGTGCTSISTRLLGGRRWRTPRLCCTSAGT